MIWAAGKKDNIEIIFSFATFLLYLSKYCFIVNQIGQGTNYRFNWQLNKNMKNTIEKYVAKSYPDCRTEQSQSQNTNMYRYNRYESFKIFSYGLSFT